MAVKFKTLRYALPLALMASVATIPLSAEASGTVNPVWGSLNPVWGSLNPVWGSLNPVWGSLNPVWGSLNPVWGTDATAWSGVSVAAGGGSGVNPYLAANGSVVKDASGKVVLTTNPFWGTTQAYKGAISGTTLNTYWYDTSKQIQLNMGLWQKKTYSELAGKLKEMVINANKDWATSVVPKGTPGTFETVFAKPLMKTYGIDPSSPSSLGKVTEAQWASFYMAWYDGLMNYTGTDHIDHWMSTVNWSPSLTQIQGSGADTTIGLLDFTVVGDKTIKENIVAYDGLSNFSNGHGAAVASLMVGAHDGRGVMGIAPNAKVIAYNPFDDTGTAGWEDIASGIIKLSKTTSTYKGASIINASLGEGGYAFSPGWNGVFSMEDVYTVAQNRLFVMAAGNDGKVQTTDVTWDFAHNPNFLIVGSVGLDGKTVSSFSNQPGNACLVASGGTCQTGNRLMDHYLVAPGEMILVSDDAGGVARHYGTSLTAPMVSGAIALLQDRWPWMANFPKETSDIILKSATDLGATGVDAVFGAGLLNITAAQSPLNFSNATFKRGVISASGNTTLTDIPINQVIASRASEKQKESTSLAGADGIYYYAFENIGATYRDFGIPLAQKLIGTSFVTDAKSTERFQDFLLKRLDSWIAAQPVPVVAATTSTKSSTSSSGSTKNGSGLAFANTWTMPVANSWGADMTLSMAPRTVAQGFVQSGPDYQSRVHVAGEKTSLDFGFGDGALHVGGMAGYALAADVDVNRGGMDPVLGLASGGGFANLSFQLSDRVDLSAGMTHKDALRDVSGSPALSVLGNGAERYEAAAAHLGLTYRLADGVQLMGGYTRLQEARAFLGTQSLDPADFAGGSRTDGVTLGLSAGLGRNTRLAVSGTVGKTAAGSGQNIAVGRNGVTASAYEVALTRSDLLARGDVLRMTVSQPMHVENGQVNLAIVEVTNRQTGEIGVVNHTVALQQARPFAAEALYGLPVLKGAGDVSLYGRADANPIGSAARSEFMGGARFRVRF